MGAKSYTGARMVRCRDEELEPGAGCPRDGCSGKLYDAKQPAIFIRHTLVDPSPWDRYWHDQLTHGIAGFVRMFCDDGSLVDAMRANGILSIPHGAPAPPRVET